MYPVEIREEPPRRVVGIDHKGAYNTIGPAFMRLSDLVTERGLWPRMQEFLGVFLDDPNEVPEVDLRAMAAISVAEDLPLPEGMQQMRVAGGRYAVLRFTGAYEGLPAAWQWLYDSWLPASGEALRDAPSLEVYRSDPDKVPPEQLVTEILVPLA